MGIRQLYPQRLRIRIGHGAVLQTRQGAPLLGGANMAQHPYVDAAGISRKKGILRRVAVNGQRQLLWVNHLAIAALMGRFFQRFGVALATLL